MEAPPAVPHRRNRQCARHADSRNVSTLPPQQKFSLGLFVQGVLSAEPAIFTESQFVRRRPLVFRRCIVSLLTLGTCKGYIDSHLQTPFADVGLSFYSIISLTTPAPTVRPPSLTANRSSFSMAIGVINSAVIAMLSPGITISTPSGRSSIPVTSVVRK